MDQTARAQRAALESLMHAARRYVVLHASCLTLTGVSLETDEGVTFAVAVERPPLVPPLTEDADRVPAGR